MDNPYYEKLVQAAIRYISFRPRSEKELRDFLTQKLSKWKVAGDMLTRKVIERMRELGYVDDEVFAAWWISQRATFKYSGERLITYELQKKGIAKNLISRLLANKKGTEAGFDERHIAQKAIEKKIAKWAKLPKIKLKKNVYTYLGQRGFSSSTIEGIIDGLSEND